MKKTLLLMAAVCAVASVDAQVNAGSAVRVGGLNSGNQNYLQDGKANVLPVKNHASTANKTTGPGGSRWYNYVDHVALLNTTIVNRRQLPYMWNRPDMYAIYSDGSGGLVADTLELASYAMTFDPVAQGATDFNDPNAYPGEIAVKNGNAYTVDSVSVWGIYGRNSGKPSVVDTLRFSFIYGNGGATNMPFYYFDGMAVNFPPNDTVRFGAIWHDVVKNIASKNPNATGTTPAVVVKDVLLTDASVNDTTSSGWNVFSVAPALNVPALNYVGATVTFISGEQDNYTPFTDTVFLGSANPTDPFKYGMFRPMFFEENDGAYPTYTPGNWNVGHVKFLPESASWDSLYVPSVAYTAPFELELPYVDFKISCTNCDLTSVGNVKNVIGSVGDAFPNPATEEVSISFNLNEMTNVNVTLSNTMGQLVKSQNVGKVNAGKATFNVADLSAGVYFCTVEANGQRVTRRVVVTH